MKAIQYLDRAAGQLVTESPPGESYLKFLYHNPLGGLALHSVVKRKFLSSIYGRMMDKPSSTSKIKGFVDSLNIDMSEAIKPIDAFTSFNDFFYRKLKPESRPIRDGIVSPADAKVLAFDQIDDVRNFYVKGQRFTLSSYLQNKILATDFANSSMLIFRLAPNDYHRFHFPYAGHVSDTTAIRGSYYSVSPYALEPNFARVFCENKRSYLTLSTVDKGRILLSPVGATMVGSIIHTYIPNSDVVKGDEMGYFAFGGSTVVMLVDRNYITLDQDLLDNTKNGIETAVMMGDRIGV